MSRDLITHAVTLPRIKNKCLVACAVVLPLTTATRCPLHPVLQPLAPTS
jgi:hypothetical protein